MIDRFTLALGVLAFAAASVATVFSHRLDKARDQQKRDERDKVDACRRDTHAAWCRAVERETLAEQELAKSRAAHDATLLALVMSGDEVRRLGDDLDIAVLRCGAAEQENRQLKAALDARMGKPRT